jgi:hypothetical protein
MVPGIARCGHTDIVTSTGTVNRVELELPRQNSRI